jgi:hypothetical protein
MIAVNPFNWRTVLLAKHAQHVVLIHFSNLAGFDRRTEEI